MILYIKMVTGEDVVARASKEDVENDELEFLALSQPMETMRVVRGGRVFIQMMRWCPFLEADDVVVPKGACVIVGHPTKAARDYYQELTGMTPDEDDEVMDEDKVFGGEANTTPIAAPPQKWVH